MCNRCVTTICLHFESQPYVYAVCQVLLRYWHPDQLAAMLDSQLARVARAQAWVRTFVARRRFLHTLTMASRDADDVAVLCNFIDIKVNTCWQMLFLQCTSFQYMFSVYWPLAVVQMIGNIYNAYLLIQSNIYAGLTVRYRSTLVLPYLVETYLFCKIPGRHLYWYSDIHRGVQSRLNRKLKAF